MEFNLEFNRGWIVGISDEDFSRKVEAYRQQLHSLPEAQKLQGVLISERDPIEFAAIFFAAVSIDFPIILANPSWGTNERKQLQTLVDPAIHFGELGAALAADCLKAEPKLLEPGSILIPTGGTTGGVKLAIHDWMSLSAACAGVQRFLGGAPLDFCCLLPLYHVSGLMQLLRSFLSGGRIRFGDTVVTGYCLSLVPTQLQRLLGEPKSIEKLNTARAIFVGGAAMPEAVAEKARAHMLPIIPVYGMTETAAMCAAVPAAEFLRGSTEGAVPIGDAKFSIAGDGRIRIQTDALFKGYHGREPINLSQGYLTGDVGHIDGDGRLHVEGRADRIIISGGEKIDPREVQRALEQLSGVGAALAVGLPDPEWGQKLVAFYTGTEIVDWKQKLQAKLTNYKIPKRLVRVDQLPLDARGKYAATVGASLVKTAEAAAREPNNQTQIRHGLDKSSPYG